MQKELIEGGGQLARGQSMITEENAQKMMDDLVRLCDNIERYGLVDYQYGVWEEQIAASKFQHVTSFLTCGRMKDHVNSETK